MDAHAEDEIDLRLARGLRRLVHVRLRVERQPDLQPVLARERDDVRQVRAGLEVDGDAVGAGFGELRDVPLRALDHQVAVEHAARAWTSGAIHLSTIGPDRHGRDEVAVADVPVEDPALGAQQHLDLLAEAREVGRVERRLDLDRPDPVVPAHGADDRSRAMKNPEVWSRCGSVSRNSGRADARTAATPRRAARARGRLASTTASFSSALMRADRVDDRPARAARARPRRAAGRAAARGAARRASAGRAAPRARRGPSRARPPARGRTRRGRPAARARRR